MLELSRKKSGGWNLGYGGDTINTAIHLSRAGHNVAYLTAIGSDSFSDDLVQNDWKNEGLDVSLVLRHRSRSIGLYAITTDDVGERSFTYWRDRSAARRMFGLPGVEAAIEAAAQTEFLAYSLITLAILPPEDREKLFALCHRVRANGAKVVFDSNYRPKLWPSVEAARDARDAAIACADIGLPTFEDENILTGAPSADDVAGYWRGLGCAEVIVKMGARGARLPDGQTILPPKILQPVDTSGAGDAFNAGYLAARMDGTSIEDAVLSGHRLAGWCVMRQGAIPSRES